MALSPAEKQARYRARCKVRLQAEMDALRTAPAAGPDERDAELERLRAENEKLRMAVAAYRSLQQDSSPKGLTKRIGLLEDELRIPFVDGDAVAHVAAMKKDIPAGDQVSLALHKELFNEVRFHAPAKIRAVHQAVERKVAKLQARLPSKQQARRLKIAALAADAGATDGERAAAAATLKRLHAH